MLKKFKPTLNTKIIVLNNKQGFHALKLPKCAILKKIRIP